MIPILSPLDMNSQKIVNLLDPTSAQDAASKGYVDSVAGGSAIQATERQTTISADGTNTTFQVLGDVVTASFSGGGVGAGSNPASVGGNAGTSNVGSWSTNKNYTTGQNPKLWVIAWPGRLNNQRVWFGLTDQTAATMGAGDNPAGNYAAFRFSSGAGDTNWQCITKDNTTQTIVDSGVSVAANVVARFAIVCSNSAVLFYINSNLVATITTNLPTTATPLRFVLLEVSTNGTNTNNGISLVQAVIRSSQ